MKKTIFIAGLLCTLAASVLWADWRDDRLIDAVRSQDLPGVKIALEYGANVNATTLNEETALMLACSESVQSLPIVRILVEAGANSSYKNNYGITALMFAARDCTNDNIVKYLVSRAYANIENTDNNGKTALMYAVENKNDDVLQYLLKAGANFNAVDGKQNTPIMLAVINGNELAVKRLGMQTGIDWNAKNADGDTVFMLAVKNKNASILRILLTGNTAIDRNIKVNDDQPLLFYAIQTNASETIIDYLMNVATKEVLLYAKDLQRHNLEWYITQYENDYAKDKLEQIKRKWGL